MCTRVPSAVSWAAVCAPHLTARSRVRETQTKGRDAKSSVDLDMTRLTGHMRGTCFHLFLILDIFGCYVVGWMVAGKESAEPTDQLVADTAAKEAMVLVPRTLNADGAGACGSRRRTCRAPAQNAQLHVALQPRVSIAPTGG